MNYIYGTWSVLCALSAIGMDRSAPEIRNGVGFLLSIQNPDGGWGEDGASYKLDHRGHEKAPSTVPQTAWALLGLLAAGEANHPAVERGIGFSDGTSELQRDLVRDAFHRDRISARLLPALSWLCAVLSPLGAGALP